MESLETMRTGRAIPHVARVEARPDVFARAEAFELSGQLRAAGVMPYFRELTRNEGATCEIEGRTAIMLGSNNYLGLTTDARVRRAASEAVLRDGPSLTGSRLLNGTTVDHTAFERELAEFLGREDALVFTTGYQANVGLLSALLPEGSTLVVDRLCHASIHDGARVARARVVSFRHNDPKDLDAVLESLPVDEVALVMVDGVYSMEGDIAPLPAIRSVCERHGVRLVVDEAHALGVLGATGRGTEEHYGMPGAADLLSGTFSKSLASVGGWVAGPASVIEWIRFHGRSMIFSASLPPGQLAAAREALAVLRGEPWRVLAAQANGRAWRERLSRLGLEVGESETPIVPVHVGDELLCLAFGRALLDAGVYVNPVVHPAVPRGSAMIRTSVMATHDAALLDRAAERIAQVAREVGVLRAGASDSAGRGASDSAGRGASA